tara:strand:- start:17483 stop:18685 length:1203 start_codon:yes stop_codon:yes gene_type:complete
MNTNTQTTNTGITIPANVNLPAQKEIIRPLKCTFNEADRDLIFKTFEKDTQPEHYLEDGCFVFNDNPNRDLIHLIYSIDCFVEYILTTDDEFNLSTRGKYTFLRHNKLVTTTPFMNIDLLAIHTDYNYSENVKLFCLALEDIDVSKENISTALLKNLSNINVDRGSHKAQRISKLISALNTFIRKIRALGKETGINRKIATRKHNCLRNYNSITSFINKLFDNHSRLLVLRVDIGYSKDQVTPSLEDVQCDFKRFTNNIRTRRRFQDLVGYVWKLELGGLKGYHYHLILFFDGSKVQNDYFHASEIGEYWKANITNQRGTYFSCNGSKQKKRYKELGIGMINHKDFKLRHNLNSVVAYLTKGEQYLAIKLTSKTRTIGKSIIKQKCTSGRPRTTKPEMLT